MHRLLSIFVAVAAALLAAPVIAATDEPLTVHFLSDDGTTTLVAYLYAAERREGSLHRPS